MTIFASSLHYFRLAMLALACISALPFYAAQLTVTNTNDSGAGSLRQAVANAQSGDTIQFKLPNPSTITVASKLSICSSQSLTINGPGASQLAISGNGSSQVLDICSGANVTLSGLTIEKGSSLIGGGIENDGTLTITNSTLSGNTADSGGGIYNTGTLTGTAILFSGNSASGGCSGGLGGAIANADGSVTLTNSTVSGNSANCSGGGIYSSGTLTLTSSTVSNNSAPDGAGIDNRGNNGSSSSLLVINSTLSVNSASNNGGGISNFIANATVINSTLSGNSAGFGGAIWAYHATILLTNSTIVGNSSPQGAMAVFYAGDYVKSTLFASNTGGNCSFEGGSSNYSQGYNLSDDNTCVNGGQNGLDDATDKNNTPAQLDPKGLQNNGGPTQTIALLPTSPAVDAIPIADCTDTNGSPVTADQRGITRPQGKSCDIGAYELVQAVPFANFHPTLAISTGKKPGFILTSTFTLGSASTGLTPATEAMTLQIANYTLTLPAGSFHQLWSGSNAPYGYEGTVNGATVVLGLIPLGNNTYSFDAAASPVTFPGLTNPVAVTLTFGNDTGTSSVKALITNY